MSSENLQVDLRIPRDRVAVLIGKEGEVKRELESKTKTKIDVDSKEGEILIHAYDGLRLFEAREIILAIGRGFNPQIALALLNVEYVFDVLNIKDFATTKNSELRLKSRLIGTKGKTRQLIEELSEAHVSIYGKTISFIGRTESVHVAKHAVMMLLGGSPHSSVYHWLERKRKELKSQDFASRESSAFEESDASEDADDSADADDSDDVDDLDESDDATPEPANSTSNRKSNSKKKK